MKKKLLSLVLAGAMVASTSVSAFAVTDTTKEVTVDSNGTTSRVDIEGNVQNGAGEVVSGTISVTVPTAISFTIDKSGNIDAGNIEIVNRNSEKDKVEVVAKQFNDPKPTTGIVLVKDGELDNKITQNSDANIRYMSLNLEGTDGSVGLVSSKSDSSIGLVDATGTEVTEITNKPLGNAWEGNSLTLNLTGRTTKTGETYTPPTNAIRSNFNLVLKIQKVKKATGLK